MNFIERQLCEIFGGTWYTLYNTDGTLFVRAIDGMYGDFETTVHPYTEELLTILHIVKEYIRNKWKEK